MSYKYAFKNLNEHMARAIGMSLPISKKHAMMVCNFIRGRNLNTAKADLENVIDIKTPVPFTMFEHGVGHRKGIGSGRYPVKASENILKTLKSVEANAKARGLNTNNMIIQHICVQEAPRQHHYGRQRGILMKSCHVEVVVKEIAAKKEAKKAKKNAEVKQEETKK